MHKCLARSQTVDYWLPMQCYLIDSTVLSQYNIAVGLQRLLENDSCDKFGIKFKYDCDTIPSANQHYNSIVIRLSATRLLI